MSLAFRYCCPEGPGVTLWTLAPSLLGDSERQPIGVQRALAFLQEAICQDNGQRKTLGFHGKLRLNCPSGLRHTPDLLRWDEGIIDFFQQPTIDALSDCRFPVSTCQFDGDSSTTVSASFPSRAADRAFPVDVDGAHRPRYPLVVCGLQFRSVPLLRLGGSRRFRSRTLPRLVACRLHDPSALRQIAVGFYMLADLAPTSAAWPDASRAQACRFAVPGIVLVLPSTAEWTHSFACDDACCAEGTGRTLLCFDGLSSA